MNEDTIQINIYSDTMNSIQKSEKRKQHVSPSIQVICGNQTIIGIQQTFCLRTFETFDIDINQTKESVMIICGYRNFYDWIYDKSTIIEYNFSINSFHNVFTENPDLLKLYLKNVITSNQNNIMNQYIGYPFLNSYNVKKYHFDKQVHSIMGKYFDMYVVNHILKFVY